MSRGMKILQMTQNTLYNNNLLLPKYESTKGTTLEEKNLAIENFKLIQNDEVSTNYDDSGSEYIPCSSCSSGSEDNVEIYSQKMKKKVEHAPKNRKSRIIKQDNVTSLTTDDFQNNNFQCHAFLLHPNFDNCGSTANNVEHLAHRVLPNIENETSSDQDPNVSSSILKPLENIHIESAKKIQNKRVRDSRHSCYYCHSLILNLARHLEIKHSKETEVAKLLSYPKQSKDRKDGLAEIMKVGDFYHNCDVLAMKLGQLILVRRPSCKEAKGLSFNDYGPCPHCLGFTLKKHLWHHIKYNCKKANNTKEATLENSRHIIAESNAILCSIFGGQFANEFTVNIVSKLRDDNIGRKCKEDNLILRFGAMQYEKYSNTQAELIRQSMRQLGRLLIKLQENHITKLSLREFFIPKKFDDVVQAVKSLCVSHTLPGKKPEFDIPSLGLKVGYAIRKCISIERGIALRKGDFKKNKELLSFMNLMDMEWSTRISSAALSTLYQRKMNTSELLPLTSDLLTLAKYIDREIILLKTTIRNNCTQSTWNNLAVLTLGRIILFNKRRSGEASKLTIQQYKSRPLWKEQCTEELKSSLSNFERDLAEKLTVVEIVGKRGRKVPLILTEETKSSIELLLKSRSNASIHAENLYVFARGNKSLGYLRGHDCLRQLCIEAQLEHPEYITGTKLRKYIATVCQVFSLSETENDWLARHLGHDIRVHREFYRLHENAVELTKISRLLIAVDQGEAAKFSGKPLKDITLDELPRIEEEGESNSENEDGNDENDRGNNDCILPKNNESATDFLDKKNGWQRTGKSVGKRKWSNKEVSAVLTYFKTNVKNRTLPGKRECGKCILENEVLKNRKWSDVKFYIKNHLTRIKRQKP